MRDSGKSVQSVLTSLLTACRRGAANCACAAGDLVKASLSVGEIIYFIYFLGHGKYGNKPIFYNFNFTPIKCDTQLIIMIKYHVLFPLDLLSMMCSK